MAIGAIGGVIYANQQMAGIAAEVGANNNRFELQALAAQAASAQHKRTVQEVRPAEENQSLTPDREHQREQADQEEKRSNNKDEEEPEKILQQSLHILDIKV